jgi:predicted nuclease of predicted toxin-antitoxin system
LRFLADHNVEAPIIERLRSAGHDVLAVAEAIPPEAPDDEVLALATAQDRVLLTNDKDFGELTFLQRRLSAGIVLLRMPSLDSPTKVERTEHAIALVTGRVHEALVVITERRIRRRPFL